MFQSDESKGKRFGGAGLNILKSAAALALMGVLALYANAYFGERGGGHPKSGAAMASDAAPQAPQAPPAVPVVGHVVAEAGLAVAREYIGRVEPIQTVQIRPRVSGQIESVHFKEGSIVREGDPLFTIDSDQYEATVALRKADLSKAQASLSRASKYNERLQAADKRSVSANDLDMSASDVQQNKASIEQAKAALTLAQIDLGFTKIKAPITGRIGRVDATKGNFVAPSGGPLATIAQIDPIRVSFAMPDREYMEQIGAFQSSGSPVFKAELTLADGTKYPSAGERDFEDNAMDSATGTITLHLKFENKKGTLIPGSMVRVSAKPVKARVSPVIPQEAVMSDAKSDYVYVISGDVAARRDVKLGAQIGAAREVVSGLAAGEKIIASGLQNVRPGAPVKPSYPSQSAAKTPAEAARESGYDLPAAETD